LRVGTVLETWDFVNKLDAELGLPIWKGLTIMYLVIFLQKYKTFFFSQTQMHGFASGSSWILIVFGSWIRIRIRVKSGSGSALKSKACRGRSKWRLGGSVGQWSQIRISLLRSRIQIRNEVAGSGSATSRKTAEQKQTSGLLTQRCKATPRHRDTQTPSSLRPPTWTASGKICNFR
jgi:hypothetical protein